MDGATPIRSGDGKTKRSRKATKAHEARKVKDTEEPLVRIEYEIMKLQAHETGRQSAIEEDAVSTIVGLRGEWRSIVDSSSS